MVVLELTDGLAGATTGLFPGASLARAEGVEALLWRGGLALATRGGADNLNCCPGKMV